MGAWIVFVVSGAMLVQLVRIGPRLLAEDGEDGLGDDADDADDGKKAKTLPAGDCPDCGEAIDPDSGVCESCLHALVRRTEKDAADLERGVDPDPAEESAVERLRAFLAEDLPGDACFCPACLVELSSTDAACRACSKPALAMVDLKPHLERQIADITAEWYVPLLDGWQGPFFGAVIDALETATPPYAVKICKAYASWSQLNYVLSTKVPILFLRRKELRRFRALVLSVDANVANEPLRAALLGRLNALIGSP